MAELPINTLPKTTPGRVWELEVPLILDENKKVLTAYISNKINEPFEYDELCHNLREADSIYKVNLYLNTPGGVIDSAFTIANAIKDSQAEVTAILNGTVASAGTIIALSCDDIIVKDHLSFMVHNYSGGIQGKGNEMKARQNFNDAHLNEAFKHFYTGFLTEDEIQRVIDGIDLWMGSEEVKERWANRQAYLKQKNT